jgi:hypothetical protein
MVIGRNSIVTEPCTFVTITHAGQQKILNSFVLGNLADLGKIESSAKAPMGIYHRVWIAPFAGNCHVACFTSEF